MTSTAPGSLINGINSVQNFINSTNPLTQSSAEQFKSDGFLIPATFEANGTGLPSSQVPSFRSGQLKRNIISWFVPEFGVVQMYVNPHAITYNHKKLITKDRTKGGYTLQYWGEDLSTLNISGTTGGAGIEGINVLYEIYRAEQYAFDAVGLSLAAQNFATQEANSLIGGISGAVGGLFSNNPAASSPSGLLNGLLGLNNTSQNITSLAQLAFTVEMFYNGMVYKGFFENMTVNERADNFLLEYNINFTVTQIRGYRMNYFPWSKSAIDGSSQYTTPNSFSGSVTVG